MLVKITRKTLRTIRPGDHLLFVSRDHTPQVRIIREVVMTRTSTTYFSSKIHKKRAVMYEYKDSGGNTLNFWVSNFTLSFLNNEIFLLTKHELPEIKTLYIMGVLDNETLRSIKQRPTFTI